MPLRGIGLIRVSIYDIFLRYRKLIFTVNGPINVAEEPGFIHVLIEGLVTGLELKAIATRIRDGKERRRAEGRLADAQHTLPRAIAYDFETFKWSWVEPYASRIKQAFLLVLEGHSVRSIARDLGFYSHCTLRHALRNPIYNGIREHKHEAGEEKYLSKDGKQARRKRVLRKTPLRVRIDIEPLVTEEVFLKV